MTCPRSHSLSGAELGPEPTLLSRPAIHIFRVSIDWLLTLPLSPQPPTLLKLSFIRVCPQPPLLFVLCSSHPSIRASHQSRFLTLLWPENPDWGAGGWFWERLAAQVCPMGERLFTIPLSCVYSGFNSSESIRDFPWESLLLAGGCGSENTENTMVR